MEAAAGTELIKPTHLGLAEASNLDNRTSAAFNQQDAVQLKPPESPIHYRFTCDINHSVERAICQIVRKLHLLSMSSKDLISWQKLT